MGQCRKPVFVSGHVYMHAHIKMTYTTDSYEPCFSNLIMYFGACSFLVNIVLIVPHFLYSNKIGIFIFDSYTDLDLRMERMCKLVASSNPYIGCKVWKLQDWMLDIHSGA